MVEFTVVKKDAGTRARVGRLATAHGIVQTPAFMPVGTQGAVKAVAPRDLKEIGCEILLSNTYHLYLRPGVEVIRDLGGLQRFMGWNGPVLTDSGGYQVLSLGAFRKISEDGVRFQSHLDGSSHKLTPEGVVEMQGALGSDLAMVLDECIPYPASREYASASTDRTLRWARRSLDARRDERLGLLAIVQGGVYRDVRERCAEALVREPFDGYAVGGLGIGEGESLFNEVSDAVVRLLPEERPRYLMGLGRPEDLISAVRRGYDLFDCVIPTRNARNGTLFTFKGRISIKRAAYSRDQRPVDDECGCYCCRNFSRAYLRHLHQSKEILAAYLHTLHNLYFYQRLLDRMRQAVLTQRPELWPSIPGCDMGKREEEEQEPLC